MADTTSPPLFHRGGSDSPFFRSKFRVPALPRHFVRRPRLIELLDNLSYYPVTALVAPAGAGKTTLAADWLGQPGRKGVWLALEDTDRDPHQLLTALAAVLDQVVPGVAEEATLAARRQHASDDGVHALVGILEDLGSEPVVLVIDDIHFIDDDDDASAALAAFVEHKPEWLGLLLVSRRRLPLSVDRLRATGVLADVNFDALRFRDAEAIEMLSKLCPGARPEDLADVATWANGWAAALQFAALALRSKRETPSDGPALAHDTPAGTDAMVIDYLWHEVLRSERPEMVDLLLDVLVIDRVSYPLAEALTQRSDAGDILAEAAQRGLFITKSEPGGWFQMHELVRTMLLAELERRLPDRVRQQHVRAAEWYESMDNNKAALDHWIAAGMYREAVRRLATLAFELFEGGSADVIRCALDTIAPNLMDADGAALIDLAWCQFFVDKAAFEQAMAAAEDAVVDSDRSLGRLMILRSISALSSGDWVDCERFARSGLELVQEPAWLDKLGQHGWTLAAHGIALDERWDDSSSEVVRIKSGVSHHPLRALALEGTRALGLALSGSPTDALRTTAAVRRSAESSSLGTLRLELTLSDAIAHRELGDKTQARQLLEELVLHPPYPTMFIQLTARLELVGLHLDNGDRDEAEQVFRAATEICEETRARRSATDRLARYGLLLETARGDLDAAARWSRRTDDLFWRPVGEAHVALSRKDPAQAETLLRHAKARSPRHEVVRQLMLATVLRHDERDLAEKAVIAACEVAAERGMLQTVGSAGRGVTDLLELAAWRVPEAWMQRLRRVLTNGEVAEPRPQDGRTDTLTAREREVLRLLPSRLTLREVASELFVSHNTLKFHLRVIYQKLGVNSRAGAVDEARQLGLLRRA